MNKKRKRLGQPRFRGKFLVCIRRKMGKKIEEAFASSIRFSYNGTIPTGLMAEWNAHLPL